MLIGWCSWNKRTARVAPRVNVEVAPDTGRITSRPRIRILIYLHNSNKPGTEIATVWNPKSGYIIVDWGSKNQQTTANGCKKFSKFTNRHRILYTYLLLIME